jgi:hypothetical protein
MFDRGDNIDYSSPNIRHGEYNVGMFHAFMYSAVGIKAANIKPNRLLFIKL